MKVLIACEHSGVLRRAFREAGYHAWSCDILPAEDYSKYHFQCDVFEVLADNHWDLLIAFPPCTYLTRAGAQHWKKLAPGLQMNAIAFARMLSDAPSVQFTAVENPPGILSTKWRKPDQYIQPWQFGHGETKQTGLWLKNLPLLQPTEISPLRLDRVHMKGESKDRWKHRSRTYTGIANAMVQQWGPFVKRKLGETSE